MSDEAKSVQEQEVQQEEAQAPETTEIKNEARRAIYAKYDASKREAEKAEAQEQEEKAPEEEPAKAEEAPPEESREEGKAEAAEEASEEKPTPREKRKAENLEAKEKRLSAWEQQLVDKFHAAEKPPEPRRPIVDSAQTPLRHLTEDQVQARYDELASESAYKATKFLKDVESAKEMSARETEEQRIEADFRDFRDTCKDATEDDWLRMNDPKFYQKYPDILRAMDRREHYSAFVLAHAHLREEAYLAEKQAAEAREKERKAELDRREESKKKGTVLRVQTKVINPQTKEEAPPTAEETKRRRVAEMVAASRSRQGLGPPRT